MTEPHDSEICHKDRNNSAHQRNPNNQYRGNNGPWLNRFQTEYREKGRILWITNKANQRKIMRN